MARGRSYENIFTQKFFQRKFHYTKISGFTVLTFSTAEIVISILVPRWRQRCHMTTEVGVVTSDPPVLLDFHWV